MVCWGKLVKPAKLSQPQYFAGFRCLGSDCDDTCCDGWGLIVDKETYNKYENSGDPELQSAIGELITINANESSADNYAAIKLSETHCPFLSEGLCSIQRRLGEEYLAKTCATYPRVMNLVDGTLERSLDLSCPEAARLALLNPSPMHFEEADNKEENSRIGNLAVLETFDSQYPGKPYRYFQPLRGLVVSLLQNRKHPVWKRLVIVGYLCDKLNEMAAEGAQPEILQIIQGYLDANAGGLFDDHLCRYLAQPATQLEIVLELIVCRIGSEFTARRFMECYRECMQGVGWTQESTMEDLGSRYTAAYTQYYAPFLSEHEYLMEHYLINYVYRTLFPLGPQQSSRKLGIPQTDNTICTQYRLMAAYYAIIQTVLIGLAGFHKSALSPAHAIKLIQSFTKNFEHSLSYPSRVIQVLTGRGLKNAASMAVLFQN